MRPIATDNRLVWCVSQSVARLRCAKTAERIEVVFGTEIQFRFSSFSLSFS